jgi:simple sugar transport system permease protein
MIRPVSVPVINDTFMAWSGARYYIPFLYTVNRRGIQTFAYLTPASIAVLSALVLVIVLLKFTRVGRSLYAVGGNAQSALLMGIDPQKTKMFAHIACGLLAGLGGLVFTLCTPSGSPDYGRAYEIQAISSSIIGGAMLSGGVGLPIGTFFGVMINLLVERVVPNFGLIEPSWPMIITSVFLFAFIVLQSLLSMAGKKGGFRRLLGFQLKQK